MIDRPVIPMLPSAKWPAGQLKLVVAVRQSYVNTCNGINSSFTVTSSNDSLPVSLLLSLSRSESPSLPLPIYLPLYVSVWRYGPCRAMIITRKGVSAALPFEVVSRSGLWSSLLIYWLFHKFTAHRSGVLLLLLLKIITRQLIAHRDGNATLKRLYEGRQS